MHPIWHFVNGVPTMGVPVVMGPLSVSSTAVTSTVPYLAPVGSATAPSYSFAGFTNKGFYSFNTDQMRFAAGGTAAMEFASTYLWMLDNAAALTLGASADVSISRGAAGQLNSNSSLARTGANGQLFHDLQALTELTTIAAAATTDTTIQMPANAVVLGVSVRVTVAIPTATTFTVGDSGSAARFSTAAVSVNLNSTDPGTKAGAYYNASALSIRITPNGTPAANTGRVRVTIYYYSITPPTS